MPKPTLPAQNALPMDFPKPTPKAPTPGTIAHTAIVLMLTAGAVDADTFHAATGSHSLPQTVGHLRDAGWPAMSYDVPRPLPTMPHRRLVAYVLDLEQINLPDELGNIGAAQ